MAMSEPEIPETAFPIEAVGVLRSPFDEKFGTPRQPGLVDAAEGVIEFFPPYDRPAMLDGLAGFSHLWILFRFDRCAAQGWRPRVRPPRLGGNREVGVWASRSPFRPNHIGLSVVRLIAVEAGPPARLRVGGVDMTDGTPVVDIKPYVPYADCIRDADAGYAAQRPLPRLRVAFAPDVDERLRLADPDARLRQLITDVIALDPRPAYRVGVASDRRYAMQLGGYDIGWCLNGNRAEIDRFDPVDR
jgi:tRNA-Thr(GGU) m(6)t(6)A37 methyltransferase TsaA